MKKFVLTIGREHGSGGRQIAEKAAAMLGVQFYDRKMITLASIESGLPEEVVEEFEQKRTNSFLYSLYMSTQILPLSDQVFIAQSKVIKDLASKESCVVVGRCADYILRDFDNCIRVFIHAPIDDRIERVKNEYKIESKDYVRYIAKTDKDRNDYYNYNTHMKWGDYKNYHLSLDSSIGIDLSASIIADMVKGMAKE